MILVTILTPAGRFDHNVSTDDADLAEFLDDCGRASLANIKLTAFRRQDANPTAEQADMYAAEDFREHVIYARSA